MDKSRDGQGMVQGTNPIKFRLLLLHTVDTLIVTFAVRGSVKDSVTPKTADNGAEGRSSAVEQHSHANLTSKV